jgi:hypothetical protein
MNSNRDLERELELYRLREAAFAAVRPLLPTRYLSDPDVINNAEETKLLNAQWDEYFRRMREVDEKYPIKGLTDANQAKVTPDTTSS